MTNEYCQEQGVEAVDIRIPIILYPKILLVTIGGVYYRCLESTKLLALGIMDKETI